MSFHDVCMNSALLDHVFRLMLKLAFCSKELENLPVEYSGREWTAQEFHGHKYWT